MGKVVTMKRATLSMEQANLLFARECMAVSGKNVITLPKALSVLSAKAVEYANNPSKGGHWWNVFSCVSGG